jgi:hypothetical protein
MTYIAIRCAGNKYIVHPSTEQSYLNSKSQSENYVWYFTSDKSIDEFAIAGAFGTYDSYQEAEGAILAVDPGAQKIYKPNVPPTD